MSMRAPVIGIAVAVERAAWGVWEAPVHMLPREYADAVAAGGGIAMLLVPAAATIADPEPLLDRLDGLILAGGVDLDPALYRQQAQPESRPGLRERDDFELALTHAAIARDLPLLGICRGMQILNVARGGTLYQHLPDQLGHGEHRPVAGSFAGADHPVRLVPGSLVAAAAGEERHRSFSHHHQGVDEIGDRLVVSGRSEIDELVEAIELPELRFALGVQWHPEVDPDSKLIAAFVAACRQDP